MKEGHLCAQRPRTHASALKKLPLLLGTVSHLVRQGSKVHGCSANFGGSLRNSSLGILPVLGWTTKVAEILHLGCIQHLYYLSAKQDCKPNLKFQSFEVGLLAPNTEEYSEAGF